MLSLQVSLSVRSCACAPIDVHSSAAVFVPLSTCTSVLLCMWPLSTYTPALTPACTACLHCLPALASLTQDEAERGGCVGLDVSSGEPADPHLSGVLDNFIVKRQILQR